MNSTASPTDPETSVTTPLLRNEDEALSTLLSAGASKKSVWHSTFARVAIFIGIMFCLSFHEGVLVAPYFSLMERAICKTYYSIQDPSMIGDGGWVPEQYCKKPAVQHELALIRGWKSFFDTLPGKILQVSLLFL